MVLEVRLSSFKFTGRQATAVPVVSRKKKLLLLRALLTKPRGHRPTGTCFAIPGGTQKLIKTVPGYRAKQLQVAVLPDSPRASATCLACLAVRACVYRSVPRYRVLRAKLKKMHGSDLSTTLHHVGTNTR